MQFELVPPCSRLRPAVEAMVVEVFHREYGASIARFPDLMLAVLDDGGTPQCVAGLRDHLSGFFSECYLDQPVERAIGACGDLPVYRRDILELGSLASRRPGGLMHLLEGFAAFGLGQGYRWGIFTMTERLRRLSSRLGLPLLDLGPAEATRVTQPENWGRYYDFKPRVCAIAGHTARQCFQMETPAPLASPVLPWISAAVVP